MTHDTSTLISVKDFAKVVGLSVQRIHQLWDARRGPERIDTGRPASRATGPRYWVKLNDGLRWAEERQRAMPPSHRCAAQRARAWRAARKRDQDEGQALQTAQKGAHRL